MATMVNGKPNSRWVNGVELEYVETHEWTYGHLQFRATKTDFWTLYVNEDNGVWQRIDYWYELSDAVTASKCYIESRKMAA